MSLAERIVECRKACGITASELARRAKCSKSYLSELEHGKRGVGAELLLSLANVLGVSMDWLMVGDGLSHGGIPLQLPQSLMRAGYDHEWPFGHGVVLYWLMRTIQEHKAPSKRIALESVDWLKFYDAVKEWL